MKIVFYNVFTTVKPTSKSRRKSCPERVKTIEEEEEEDHGDNENLPLKKSTGW
jgi:hypothetical protein